MDKEYLNNFKKYVDEMHKNILVKLKDSKEELDFYSNLISVFNTICNEHYNINERNNKAVKELNVGINTYNGHGSRTALFECINSARNILRGEEDD